MSRTMVRIVPISTSSQRILRAYQSRAKEATAPDATLEHVRAFGRIAAMVHVMNAHLDASFWRWHATSVKP